MDSAFAKYARARKHFDELRASVDEYRSAGLKKELSFRVEYPYGDSDPRAVLTMRLELRAPSEWSLIMGDVLTNLRASLDHAVYGHATSRKKLNVKQRGNLYHPIVQTRAKWDGTSANPGPGEKLKDLVAPDVLALIERAQPFNDQEDPAGNGLAILSALVNRDKHRAVLEIPINVAALALGKTNLEIIKDGKLKTLPGGVVEKVIIVRRAIRPPRAAPSHRLGLLETSAEFLEEIELPNTDRRTAFLAVMEKLVESGGKYLDELKSVGC